MNIQDALRRRMLRSGRLVRARAVEPKDGYLVRVTFEDDTQKVIDLERFLHGPVFEPIRSDPSLFRSMRVEGGVITWENRADIDPDVLYYDLAPAWQEEPLVAELAPA
jgi:hypothetical protein